MKTATAEPPLLFRCPPLEAWITETTCARNAERARAGPGPALEAALDPLYACRECPGVRALRRRGKTPEPRELPGATAPAAIDSRAPAKPSVKAQGAEDSRARAERRERAKPKARSTPHWQRPMRPAHVCKRGHPLEGNRRPQGGCRTCHREDSRAAYRRKRQRAAAKGAPAREEGREGDAGTALCPRGHPLVGENLLRHARGWRECRRCHNDRAAESQARRRAADGTTRAAQRRRVGLPERFPCGHRARGKAVKIREDGARVCRRCETERGLAADALDGFEALRELAAALRRDEAIPERTLRSAQERVEVQIGEEREVAAIARENAERLHRAAAALAALRERASRGEGRNAAAASGSTQRG